MKKNILFGFLQLTFILGFGQNSLTPCNELNPSNAFENGLEYSTGNVLKVANDLTVRDGQNFELRQIIYNSFHDNGQRIVSIDVAYYDDNGGLPGTLMGNELNIIPTSQLEYATVTFGISRVVLDLTPFVFLGQLGVDTSYWIELSGTSTLGALHWETTSAMAQGYPSAQSSGGVYSIIDENIDGVYEWFGECESILAVQNSLEKLISIYPNPVSDVLSISTPQEIEVFKVQLLDVIGNIVLPSVISTNPSLGGLSKGMYFLKIITSEGNLTKKIIKI